MSVGRKATLTAVSHIRADRVLPDHIVRIGTREGWALVTGTEIGSDSSIIIRTQRTSVIYPGGGEVRTQVMCSTDVLSTWDLVQIQTDLAGVVSTPGV